MLDEHRSVYAEQYISYKQQPHLTCACTSYPHEASPHVRAYALQQSRSVPRLYDPSTSHREALIQEVCYFDLMAEDIMPPVVQLFAKDFRCSQHIAVHTL
jgi:hypothetical protein